MNECDIVNVASELSEQLIVQELPLNYSPSDEEYNAILAEIRHTYTNYEELLWELDAYCSNRWEEEKPCSWDTDSGMGCLLALKAHDTLKWAAKNLAEGAYERWGQKAAMR